MSKRSQREARQRNEQSEQEKLAKFSSTLNGYLNTFGQVYRQEVGDESVAAYQAALRHLSPSELKLACDESIKRCKFFPNPAEILESLKVARDKLPVETGRPAEGEVMSQKERDGIAAEIRKVGQKLSMSKVQREPGED